MIRKSLAIVLLIIILVLNPQKLLFAYDDKKSHPNLTEHAVKKSTVDSLLKNELQLESGILTDLMLFNHNTILKLASLGASLEDTPDCRATNHFHDPLRDWDQSYLTDDNTTFAGWLSARAFCNASGWQYGNRMSNVTWATGYLSAPPDGDKADTPTPFPYNWDLAREQYYQALTGPGHNSKRYREVMFGRTFETLGHVLHLLQDVSVPAHVRNDFTSHLKFIGGNQFALNNYIQPFEHFIKSTPGIIQRLSDGDHYSSDQVC